jgi:hypothetical protein
MLNAGFPAARGLPMLSRLLLVGLVLLGGGGLYRHFILGDWGWERIHPAEFSADGCDIYYAMLGGRLAAEAAEQCLASGDARALATARKRFMKEHGRVFWVLGLLQRFWYVSDKRREQFVKICRDKDVQQLTFESYMNKQLVRKRPMAHVRIFLKDLAHLFGIAKA